ncbi:MAG: hypothetical protein Q4F71_08175 [Paracoccus sp. (in: a-proteobacteria)]|nr:hypothetical protein [Paracoccus sp. (in: a-proteobacteria)]
MSHHLPRRIGAAPSLLLAALLMAPVLALAPAPAAAQGVQAAGEARPLARPARAADPAPAPQAAPASPAQPAPAARPGARAEQPASPAPAPTAPQAETISELIPCSTRLGMPTRLCNARIQRGADGAREVSVTRPDGTTRSIRFENAAPATAPGMVHEARGDLWVIELNRDSQTAERYEIRAALIAP